MNRQQRRAQARINKTDKNLRWVCNDVSDPTLEMVQPNAGESPEQALNKHIKWRRRFIVGEPMPSKELSVNQLKKIGVIGLYVKDLLKFI